MCVNTKILFFFSRRYSARVFIDKLRLNSKQSTENGSLAITRTWTHSTQGPHLLAGCQTNMFGSLVAIARTWTHSDPGS